jgi:CRP-like cAMP-binding protein
VPKIYFPVSAAVSLLAPGDHRQLEVTLVGREGIVGAEVALGVTEGAWAAVCSVGGEALCLGMAAFRQELDRSARLRQVVDALQWLQMADLANRVACTRLHSLGQRLARWLLMADERCGSGCLEVTHAQLAGLLGVRRAGVTESLRQLRALQALELHRGGVRVVDATLLVHQACPCHLLGDARYERVFRSLGKPAVPGNAVDFP